MKKGRPIWLGYRAAVEHIRYEVETLIPEIMTEEIIAAAEAREDERRESRYFA